MCSFFQPPQRLLSTFLVKESAKTGGKSETERKERNDKLCQKRVQKNVTQIRSTGSVHYVCVHLCTSGGCETFLLIGASGMEGIGLAEINAKTVCPPMKLSRTHIQLTRYQTTWKPESDLCCRSSVDTTHYKFKHFLVIIILKAFFSSDNPIVILLCFLH